MRVKRQDDVPTHWKLTFVTFVGQKEDVLCVLLRNSPFMDDVTVFLRFVWIHVATRRGKRGKSTRGCTITLKSDL